MYLKYKMTWLAIILFIGFVFLMENVLASHSTPAICQAESNMAFFMADNRDEGISRIEALRFACELSTDADRKAAIINVNLIYDNPGLEPWIVGRIAFEACLNH